MSVFRAANNVNAGNASAGINSAGNNSAGNNSGGHNSAGPHPGGVAVTGNGGSRPLDAYPINRAREETVPDGPTEPIDDRRRRRRDQLILLGMLIAFVALIVSAVAGLASWRALRLVRALGRGGAARRPAGHDQFDAVSRSGAAPGPGRLLGGALRRPRRAPGQRRRAGQRPALRQPLRETATAPHPRPGCGGRRPGRGRGHRRGRLQRAIRTSPLGPGASAEVRKGTVLCVLTAGTPAVDRARGGDRRRPDRHRGHAGHAPGKSRADRGRAGRS